MDLLIATWIEIREIVNKKEEEILRIGAKERERLEHRCKWGRSGTECWRRVWRKGDSYVVRK